MENIFDLLKQTNNTLETNSLTVKDNTLITENTNLQITNISMVEKGNLKNPITITDIVILLILLIIGFSFPPIGFPLLAIYAFFIYQRYNQHLKTKYFIVFSLNSGKDYYLYFEEANFRDKVVEVITKSFGTQGQSIYVDIKNQKIDTQNTYEKDVIQNNVLGNDNIIGNEFGQNNVISVKGDAMKGTNIIKESTVTEKVISPLPWSDIITELEDLLDNNTEKVTGELKTTLEKLLKDSHSNNEEKFNETVIKHKKLLSNSLLQNILSGTLANIISTILTGQ